MNWICENYSVHRKKNITIISNPDGTYTVNIKEYEWVLVENEDLKYLTNGLFKFGTVGRLIVRVVMD